MAPPARGVSGPLAAYALSAMCQGVQQLHQAGSMWLDTKSDTVIVDEAGPLVDVGCSEMAEEQARKPRLTGGWEGLWPGLGWGGSGAMPHMGRHGSHQLISSALSRPSFQMLTSRQLLSKGRCRKHSNLCSTRKAAHACQSLPINAGVMCSSNIGTAGVVDHTCNQSLIGPSPPGAACHPISPSPRSQAQAGRLGLEASKQ
jgi:hypothetical protein